MDAHDRLIQALTDRSVYEHPTTDITVLQTHISWIVLTGPRIRSKGLSIWALSISQRSRNGTSSARKRGTARPAVLVGAMAWFLLSCRPEVA